ncbi:MAG: hypothetical protein J1E58_00310 [Prevotella sp.]|nr:hypothetical protein [Prevotella sp.]
MRRRLKLLAILFAAVLLLPMAVHAQSGLNINPLFEGKVVRQKQMVETRVKGKMLSKYRLTYFRSVRFEGTKREIERVHQLVELDRRTSAAQSAENWFDRESHSKETLMMQLSPKDGQNRFLSYRRNGNMVTVVYMEGALDSFDALKEILK